MKIIHTADIHLKEYGDERWEALQKLIALGQKEGIELFLISGDLFDRGSDAEALRPHIRGLFSNTGFRICLIPGNHDRDSYTGGMYFGEDTVILTDLNRPCEYKDVMIWGIPFEPAEREKILHQLHSLAHLLTPNKKHIVLYHGELLDAFFSRSDFGDEGDERYMPVRLSYFNDLKVDYVLAGHFHKRFDVWRLQQGGYFVYPGSPVSITRKETGQRRINLFELGKQPREHPLDTPYFEEVLIVCDPFADKDPLEQMKERFQELPAHAQVILIITGFVNGEAMGMTEEEFVKHAKKIVRGRCVEERYEFRDIRMILEDDLFKGFLKKLEQADYAGEKKKHMREIAIRAMMGARR
ncbi:MAG: serine/threonine protein phosphatase [Deltaproteobacteria bacterium RBG_16_54_11]|nr:MAG: serine/threonine protein phosphatase [Deltaproteobacteria bacterium RBG_16_54_11]